MKKALLFFSLFFFTLLTVNGQLMVASGTSGFQNPKSAKNTLKIFPNPATDYIEIEDKNDLVNRIRVVNLVGKEVINKIAVKGKKYPISDLSNGLYLVQFIGNDGKILTTHRLRKR